MKIWCVIRLFTVISCCFFFVGQIHGLPSPPPGKAWVAVPALTDEFDTWDAAKWWRPLWNYGEPVQMCAENSGVADGKLWIKATLDSGATRWFETSRVMSLAQIRFPMYTECSMRTAHISAYNTFWLNNGDSANRDEIDICENNSNPSIVSQTERSYTMYSQYFIVEDSDVERAHGNFDNRNLSPENLQKGVKWNESYHRLGAWWIDKNNVQFYLNGEPAGSVVTTRDFTRDQNIIWDLWTADETWVGGLANSNDLSDDSINTMYVDWIHTYTLEDYTNVPSAGISIDWYSQIGTHIALGFTNGPENSYFELWSTTNLLDAVWTTNRVGLPIDSQGAGAVTNPVHESAEFYRLIESDPPSVPSIEFVAPDYTNGALDGQQNWIAEAGWTVMDAGEFGNATTTVDADVAVLNEAIQLSVGQTYGLSINLQFGGGPFATPTNWVYTFLGGLKNNNAAVPVETGGTAADANIQIFKNSDTYRLLNNYAGIADAYNITDLQLNAGDILQFDYALTLGTDASSTSYTVRLQNLSDGTDTGIGTVMGVDTSVYTALTGSGAYGFFQSINPGAEGSGLSGIQVNTVTITAP